MIRRYVWVRTSFVKTLYWVSIYLDCCNIFNFVSSSKLLVKIRIKVLTALRTSTKCSVHLNLNPSPRIIFMHFSSSINRFVFRGVKLSDSSLVISWFLVKHSRSSKEYLTSVNYSSGIEAKAWAMDLMVIFSILSNCLSKLMKDGLSSVFPKMYSLRWRSKKYWTISSTLQSCYFWLASPSNR